MSGFSSHGVGCSANADVVSAAIAAAIKRVLGENRVILHAPTTGPQNLCGPSLLNKSRTVSARQHDACCDLSGALRLCDFLARTSRLSSSPILAHRLRTANVEPACSQKAYGDDSDEPRCEILFRHCAVCPVRQPRTGRRV